MQVQVNTEELKAAILTVIPALASKSEASYTRAYEFIYISVKDNCMALKCCNLNMQIETTIPVFSEDNGELLVPGKVFAEIIRMLTFPDTTLESSSDSVRICSGSMDMSLQTIPADEFVGISCSDADNEFRIGQGVLKKMILQTSPFSLMDNTKPILGGILFEVCDGYLITVALDGLKLAKRMEKIDPVSGMNNSIIIPSKLIESAARVLFDAPEIAAVMFTKQNIIIKTDKITIIVRRMEGEFLRYRAMMPKEFDTKAFLDRKDFNSIIERAYLVARDDKSNVVKLHFESGKLTISANSEIGRVKDEIPVVIEGGDITISFNAKYLLDIIKSNIDDSEICFHMKTKAGPCVISPVSGESYYFLILPVNR